MVSRMAWGSLIRRLSVFARRHAWDGAGLCLFAVLVLAAMGPLVSGAGKFLSSIAPVPSAIASDAPARAGQGIARLAMNEGPGTASRYAPQILFPITAQALPAWLSAHMARKARGPVIAICIDDLGEDIAGTDRAMALPRAVALSFLPYADTTRFLAQEAAQRGHDILAHVPMQALAKTRPAAGMLTVDAPDNVARLKWNIARVPGLIGINNHEGSRFTHDENLLAPLMPVLAEKGLFFFDSRTVGNSRVVPVARRFGVMSAGRDIFLDDTISEEEVRRQLEALVYTAKREGVAIAIGHPHDVTLRILVEWLKQDHGVTLVTLPEALRLKSEDFEMASR